MIEIKTINDIEKIKNLSHRNLIIKIFMMFTTNYSFGEDPYNPERDGYFIYVENKEECDKFEDLNYKDLCLWEAISYLKLEAIFEAIILYNNEFGITYFIPKENVGTQFKFKMNKNDSNEITYYKNINERLGLQ